MREPWPGVEWVVTSVYKNNDANFDSAGYFIIEVRDANGTTILLDFQSGIVNAGGRINVGIPWTPLSEGSYELRTLRSLA